MSANSSCFFKWMRGRLLETYRACHHGGGIILTVPQHRWLWSGTDEVAHHMRRYETSELRRKVEAAGFSQVYSTSFLTQAQ